LRRERQNNIHDGIPATRGIPVQTKKIKEIKERKRARAKMRKKREVQSRFFICVINLYPLDVNEVNE